MDGDMIGVFQKTKIAAWLSRSCLLLFAFHPAQAAESLPDPTRPPAEAGLESPGGPVVASGPVLQSIMIRPGRRTAVISGQQLAEGERFGDARLIKVSESEVILAGPDGRQTLKLFPGVDKQFTRSLQEETLKRGKNKPKRNSEQKAM